MTSMDSQIVKGNDALCERVDWKYLASKYPNTQHVKEKFIERIQNEKISLYVNEFSCQNIHDNKFLLILNPFKCDIKNPFRALLVKDTEQMNVITRSLQCDNVQYSLYTIQKIKNEYLLSYVNYGNDKLKKMDMYHFDYVRTIIEKFFNDNNNCHTQVLYMPKRGRPF